MYPNLYYAIKDWFGLEVNAFKIFYTFGIFVAIAFIVAAIILTKELSREFHDSSNINILELDAIGAARRFWKEQTELPALIKEVIE